MTLFLFFYFTLIGDASRQRAVNPNLSSSAEFLDTELGN